MRDGPRVEPPFRQMIKRSVRPTRRDRRPIPSPVAPSPCYNTGMTDNTPFAQIPAGDPFNPAPTTTATMPPSFTPEQLAWLNAQQPTVPTYQPPPVAAVEMPAPETPVDPITEGFRETLYMIVRLSRLSTEQQMIDAYAAIDAYLDR